MHQYMKANDTAKRLHHSCANQANSIMMTGSNSHITILTLNVSGLNAPIKRYRLANWIKDQDPSVYCIQETHLMCKDTHSLKKKKDGRKFTKEMESKIHTHTHTHKVWNPSL